MKNSCNLCGKKDGETVPYMGGEAHQECIRAAGKTNPLYNYVEGWTVENLIRAGYMKAPNKEISL